MEKIELIAMDIGGTLLSDDNTISENNIKAINYAKSMGIKIALATAREYSSTKYISHNICCDYGVFSNGSHILDINNLKAIKSSLLSTQAVLELIQYCKKNNLYIHLNQEFCEVSDTLDYFALKHHMLNEQYPDELKSDCFVVPNLEEYIIAGQTATKVVIVSENPLDERIVQMEDILRKNGLFITEHYDNLNEVILNKIINYVEIGSTNDNKASGLETLVDTLGISKDTVMVIGDGKNDVEMLSAFKNSICMANGSPEIKKLASYVTTNDNNNSGVAEAIMRYVRKPNR